MCCRDSHYFDRVIIILRDWPNCEKLSKLRVRDKSRTSGYRFSVFLKASRGWSKIESIPDLFSVVRSVGGGSDFIRALVQ